MEKFEKNKIILILILIIIFIASIITGYLLSNKILFEPAKKTKFCYQDNIDMSYIQKDNISYKADYISFNDNQLEFVLNFYFPEDVSSFEGVSLSEFTVEDENGNKIYRSGEDSISYSIENSNIEANKNIIKQLYRFKLREAINAKKIILKFKKIILYNVNDGNPITKELSGDWDLKLTIFDADKEDTV